MWCPRMFALSLPSKPQTCHLPMALHMGPGKPLMSLGEQ